MRIIEYILAEPWASLLQNTQRVIVDKGHLIIVLTKSHDIYNDAHSLAKQL